MMKVGGVSTAIARRTFLQLAGLTTLVGTTGISVQRASTSTGADLTLNPLASQPITIEGAKNEFLAIPSVIAVKLQVAQVLAPPLQFVLTYADGLYEPQPDFVLVGDHSTQTADTIRHDVFEGKTTLTFTLHEPLEPNEVYTLSLATISNVADEVDIASNAELARLSVTANNTSQEIVFTAQNQSRPHWAADLGFIWGTDETSFDDHALPIGIVIRSTGRAPVPAGTELVYQADATACSMISGQSSSGKTRESRLVNDTQLHELRWSLEETLEPDEYLTLTLSHAVAKGKATPTQPSTAWLEAPKTLIPRQATQHQSTQN